MTDDPKSLKNARRHYLNWQTSLDQEALGEDLLASSDRSVVISVAAITDVALQLVLAEHLKLPSEAEHERAFENEGTLSTFSAKIDMAYWLRLIDDRVRAQLHDIRGLRNICAHSRLPISLNEPMLANVAKRILAPTGSFQIHRDPDQGIRKAFVAEGLFLHSVILHGRDEATRLVRDAYARQGYSAPF